MWGEGVWQELNIKNQEKEEGNNNLKHKCMPIVIIREKTEKRIRSARLVQHTVEQSKFSMNETEPIFR